MKKEIRTICYDEELRMEAYRLEGIVQPFPNHFHEHYVIGFVEDGERHLSCKNKEYTIEKGNILLFNPGDNHSCVQNGEKTLDYRGFNISETTMLALAEEVTGKSELPRFFKTVVFDNELNCSLLPLHQMLMSGSCEFEKEELLLFLISTLINKYSQPFEQYIPECSQEIERACAFMEQHYTEHIYLDQIGKYVGLSKSTLLRAFTKSKGVTPYRYLETIRINKAKKLLEQGVTPIEAAMQTGFSDQSHFTNYFNRFIGLAPGAYRDIFLNKKSGGNNDGK